MSANDPDGPDDRNGEESDERTMSDVDHGGPGPNVPLGDDVDSDDVVDLGPDEIESEPAEDAQDVDDLAAGFGGSDASAPDPGDVSPGAVDGTGEVGAGDDTETETSTLAEDAQTERDGTEAGAGGFVRPTASDAERSDFEFGPHDEPNDADVEEAMAGVAAGESAAASYGEASDGEAAAALLSATDEEVRASVVGSEVGMAQQNAAATLAAAMDAGYEPNDPVNALPALADETMPVAVGESETMPVAVGESETMPVAAGESETTPVAAGEPETAVEAAAAPGVSAAAGGATAATAGSPTAAAAGGATAATAGGAATAASGGATAATTGRRARAGAGAGPGWTGYYSDDPESDDREVIDLEEGEDYWWHDDDESEETGRDAGTTGDREFDDLHDRLDAVGDRLDGVGQGLDDVATGMEDLTATVEAEANARARAGAGGVGAGGVGAGAGGVGAGGVGAGGIGGLEGMLIQRGQMDIIRGQGDIENRLVRIEQKLDNLDQSPQRRPAQKQSRNWKTPTGPVKKTPKSYSSTDEVVGEFAKASGKRATSGFDRVKEGIKSRIPGFGGGDDGPEDTGRGAGGDDGTGRGAGGDDGTGRGAGGDEAFTPDDAPDVDPAAAETGSAGDPFAGADEGESTDDGVDPFADMGDGGESTDAGDERITDNLRDDLDSSPDEVNNEMSEDGDEVTADDPSGNSW